MKTKTMIIPLIIVISVLTLLNSGGCSKKEPATSPSSDSNDHAAMTEQPAATAEAKEIYTCSMHPNYISDKPGTCPECGMRLVKKTAEKPAAETKNTMN